MIVGVKQGYISLRTSPFTMENFVSTILLSFEKNVWACLGVCNCGACRMEAAILEGQLRRAKTIQRGI